MAKAKDTEGELLFTRYVVEQSIPAKRAYRWSHTEKCPDYRIDHAAIGPIVVEIKDVCRSPLQTSGAFDSYSVIRSHIHAARGQLSRFKNYPCIIALRAVHASPDVNLSAPHSMLSAMYGNLAFSFPVDLATGKGDITRMTPTFVLGEGELVRSTKEHGELPRMQYVSAILTLHCFNLQERRYLQYAKTHRSSLQDNWDGTVRFPEETAVGVTVWENFYGTKPLPKDLFRGDFDRWWSIEGVNQQLTFEVRRPQEFGLS